MGRTLRARLVAYAADGGRIGLLPQPSSWKALAEFDDVGSLTIDYDGRASGAENLMRTLESGTEIAVEVSDGGAWTEPASMRYIVVQDSGDKTDGTNSTTVTCVSYGWLLNKVLNLDTSKLLTDTDNKGKRAFYSANAGTIIETMMGENESRGGAATVIQRSFDTAKDSSGDKWAKVQTLYYSPGVSVLTMLDSMVEGGVVDWDTNGRSLRLWNADSAKRSRDLSDSIVIQLARDVRSAPYEESIEGIASHVLVSGDNGLTFTEDNPAAPTPWGKWESYYSQGGVSDEGTAKAFMQAQLDLAARVRGSYTHELLVSDAAALPFIDYRVGDWITAPTVSHGEKVRVRQLVLSLDNTDGDATLTCSATLNDSLYDYFVRQSKKIEGITGGASLAGSEGGTAAPERDHRVPKPPTGLVVGTDAYVDGNGIARGVATATWVEVTQATDDTAIDISSYQVMWRENKAGAEWRYAGSTDGTSLAWSDLSCGMTIAVRVRAMPTYSDRPGEWSDVVTATVANDVTPPSVPSMPTLASELGVVTVHWDGLNESGGGMESDFDHVAVGRGSAAGNVVEIAAAQAGIGDYIDSSVTPGVTYWYALRAVDHAGNTSDWGEAASVTVASTVSGEELDGIRSDLEQAQSDIRDNATALDQAKTDLEQAQSDIRDNTAALDQAKTDLEQAREDIDAHDRTIAQAGEDIASLQGRTDEVSQTADRAYEAAITAQTTADGRNRIYRDWQDPRLTDTELVPTVGDLWYRYQRYWTRWAGEPDASESLLADFYTYWTGEPDASESVLVPLDSRIVEVLMWDGSDWSHYDLVASNVIASGSVVADNIAANAISAEKILAGAITAEKLAALSVDADKLTANSVTADKILAGAVTADKLAANSVTADKIVSGAITADKLAANSVTADKIVSGAIGTDELAANSVTAVKIVSGAITADKLAANSVTADKIASRTITADRIKAGVITSYELAAKCVTADKISAGAVTADKLAADAITGKTISGGSYTTTSSNHSLKITSGVITGYNGGTTYGRIDFATTNGGLFSGMSLSGSTIAFDFPSNMYFRESKLGWKSGITQEITFTPASIRSLSDGRIQWVIGRQTLRWIHGHLYGSVTTNGVF